MLLPDIENLLRRDEVLQVDELSSSLWKLGHCIEAMLPPSPSQLMTLPAELREQIFVLVVTEWIIAPDTFTYIGTPPRKVRLLHQRAIRMDRLNRPSPPGMCALHPETQAVDRPAIKSETPKLRCSSSID